MRFSWDPNKNDSNVAKHGVSFLLATTIFNGAVCLLQSDRGSEERHKAIGEIEGRMFTVVFTDRETEQGIVRRIISARRARNNEIEAYKQTRR